MTYSNYTYTIFISSYYTIISARRSLNFSMFHVFFLDLKKWVSVSKKERLKNISEVPKNEPVIQIELGRWATGRKGTRGFG